MQLFGQKFSLAWKYRNLFSRILRDLLRNQCKQKYRLHLPKGSERTKVPEKRLCNSKTIGAVDVTKNEDSLRLFKVREIIAHSIVDFKTAVAMYEHEPSTDYHNRIASRYNLGFSDLEWRFICVTHLFFSMM